LAAIAALVGVTLALRKSLARERRLARTDDVTGVRNARAFHEASLMENRAGPPLSAPLHRRGGGPGNPCGRRAAALAAAALRGALRATDLIARLGRDEFIVLLPETPSAAARIVLEKLRTGLLESEPETAGRSPPAWRVVHLPQSAHLLEEIVRATDERIAEAKATGTVSHVTWNAVPEAR